MNKKIKLNKLLFILPLTTLMFCFNAPQNDDEKMKTIMLGVRNTLSYLHYSPKPINDAYSKEVYKKYFEMIDFGKRYFTEADMKEFQKYETELDNYFNQGDLSFYKLTTERLFQRYDDAEKMTADILSKPLDFSIDESILLEHKDRKYATSKEELYNEWRKYIKYNILQEIETLNSREEIQRKKKDSVIKHKLKDTIKLLNLTPEQKMEKATSDVKFYMSQSFKRLKKRKKMEWFTVYMNAHSEVFDPHSVYFSPRDKEDFDMGFTGKFIGIGAVIQEKKGKIFLGPLTVGAPAWKSKQLSEGDRILKVKSNPNDEEINVAGMFVDEVVRLIRGKKGTPVMLTVEKKDKSISVVTLIRDEVTMEDTYAKSIVIQAVNGKKYGLINLPSFNVEFGKKDGGKNASDDVKNELIKLKAYQVDGVILDLRGNGGGSLTEVGDIMELFLENAGPYVQVKDGQGKIQTLKNKAQNPVWTGPLIIMQNEFSASASEILAGAMQDYNRAVVIGSPQSFGKGTVQTFVDLNRFLSSSDDFGSLKLTIQKFYRVTGESNQRKGITADIQMKDFFSYGEFGERFDDFALPWDRIQSAQFIPVNIVQTESLKAKSNERVSNSAFYQLLQEVAQWRESINKDKMMTVQYDKFFKLMKERKEKVNKYKPIEKYDNQLKFIQYPHEIERSKKEEDFKKKSETWLKNLKRDFYLQEAVNVMSEM